MPPIVARNEGIDTGSKDLVESVPNLQGPSQTCVEAGRRIRVLQVNYLHSIGGSERLAATIGTSLDPARFSTQFAAMKGDGDLGEVLRTKGFSTTSFGRRDGFDPTVLWRVWKYLRATPIDVMQTHHVGSLVYCAAPARLQGVKIVHTEHDIHTFQRLPNELRWLRRLASLPHRYVAIDPTIADFLHSEVGIPYEKIHVIRNGIDLTTFHAAVDVQRPQSMSDPFVIGWVSRLSAPKRPDVLIDAVAILAGTDPLLRACIIGDGDLLPLAKARAKAAGVDDRIEFLGARDDIADQLRRFDCYVLCSEREGLPISLVEAMATELPCIVSGVGGIPGLLTDGVDGLVLADLDARTLADRIRLVRHRPAEASEIGCRARALARESFDLANTIEKYQEVFESVVAEPAPVSRTRRLLRPVKYAAYSVMTRLHVDAWVRRRQTDSLVVVGYHGVVAKSSDHPKSWLLLPDDEFERQIEYLKSSFEIVPLSRAVRQLADGRRFENPTACVTFDDGYKNNLIVAAPILCRQGVPATIYLATGLIGSRGVLWTAQLELAMTTARRPCLNLSDHGLGVLPLGEHAYLSFTKLVPALYRIPSRRRTTILADALQRLDADPDQGLPWLAMLSWEDVAALDAQGLFEFGGHTVSHQIVRPLDGRELDWEIGQSIEDVAGRVRSPSPTFAYPNGTPDDFDDRAQDVLQRHGILAAVSTIEGVNSSQSDPYVLRRITVGPEMTTEEFRVKTSGLADWIRRDLGAADETVKR